MQERGTLLERVEAKSATCERLTRENGSLTREVEHLQAKRRRQQEEGAAVRTELEFGRGDLAAAKGSRQHGEGDIARLTRLVLSRSCKAQVTGGAVGRE